MQSLLQSREWAELKEKQGWKVWLIEGIYILGKQLPFGKSFLYAPEVDFYQIRDFNIFLQKIGEIFAKNQSIFLRLDFINENAENITENLKKEKFIKAFEEIQPEYRQIVDISVPEEEILQQMKPKGRYNIKIAQRSGIKIEPSDKISDFYNIFAETSKRNGFSIRPQKYFEDLFKKLEPKGLAQMLVAKYDNKPIAAEIVTFYEDTASYLYGASSDQYRNLMAPYLMHWEAMKLAKQKGCKYYDLLAIAPWEQSSMKGEMRHKALDSKLNTHLSSLKTKYAGITRFKEQFGGKKVHLVGSWDYVYQPFMYKVFKIVEKIRRN